jgi:NAD(P)-dependent dehydrogenase (short-subunit alcohol dehydrogenase family)
VEGLFQSAAAQLGPVAGVVSNAGLTAHIGDLADTPVDVIRHVIDVNLVGAILCARQVAQVMSTARGGAGGAIVHISSVAATLGPRRTSTSTTRRPRRASRRSPSAWPRSWPAV